jgi:hypothetical protein
MNRHSVPRAFRAMIFCAAVSTASACGTAVAESFDEITADELPASARVVDGRWQSSDFPPLAAGDGWLSFPGRVHLKVHHPLPARPTQLLVYIAFDRSGVGGTLASGNVARIEAVGDDGTVTLHNATDEDFYVRLALE